MSVNETKNAMCTCYLPGGPKTCAGCEEQTRKEAEIGSKACTCEIIHSINVGYVPSDECFGCYEEE